MSDEKKSYDFEFENFEKVIARIKEEYTQQGCLKMGITWAEFMATSMAMIRNKLAAGERFGDIDLRGYKDEDKKR